MAAVNDPITLSPAQYASYTSIAGNCTDGRLSLTTHFEGLFFERGNGTFDADMAIRGGMDAINAALAVVEYLLIPVTVVSTPDAPTLELGTDADCNEDAI